MKTRKLFAVILIVMFGLFSLTGCPLLNYFSSENDTIDMTDTQTSEIIDSTEEIITEPDDGADLKDSEQLPDEQDAIIEDIHINHPSLNLLEQAILDKDFSSARSILSDPGLRGFFASISSGSNVEYKVDDYGRWYLRYIDRQNSPDRPASDFPHEGYSNSSIGVAFRDGSMYWFDCFTLNRWGGFGYNFRHYDSDGEIIQLIQVSE